MRTPRAQTRQRLSTPPPPPHPHRSHLTYTHGVATSNGFRNEFTPPSRPARTRDTTHHPAMPTLDAGTHQRAFAVWGQDEQ